MESWLNDFVDYLTDKDCIQAHRPGGGYELPFFFKAIKLLPSGEQWYHETIGKNDMKENNARATPIDPRKVFVVCGRNKKANKAMFAFLRSIDLDPQEWSQWVQATGQGSPYTGEVLKKSFQEAQAFVVLMTPDDEARLREHLRSGDDGPHEINLTPQPRPNVIYEAGMAMMFAEERTILVELGKLRPISDTFGRHVVTKQHTSEPKGTCPTTSYCGLSTGYYG